MHNAQLDRFNSRFWNPGSEAVDAFTCDWGGEINWLCPPLHLISRVIQHAKKTRAQGTLIAPSWCSAPFWPTYLVPLRPKPSEFYTKGETLTS